jgi:phosphate transport system substrate-binding protein
MSPKNETPALLLAFLITAGLLGGGAWWLTQKAGFNPSTIFSSNSSAPASPPNSNPPSGQSSNQSASGGKDFAQVPNVPSGLFSYGGSTTWAPIRGQVDPVIQKAQPDFRLRYVDPVNGPPGSTAGIRMLIRDELAFSQSSRPLTDQEYQQAEQRGVRLKQIPVAIDGLAVAVNPGLNIPGLTLEQLASIYLGQVTNWKALGGPDLPIVPLTRPITAGGTVELFSEQILKQKPFGPTVQNVPTTTEALRKLAASPGGIYFASAAEVVEQCTIKPIALGRFPNELIPPYEGSLVSIDQCPAQRNKLNKEAFQTGKYPLTRSLFVVIKQNGQTEEKAGEAYANFILTNEGQELVSKAGFVPVR